MDGIDIATGVPISSNNEWNHVAISWSSVDSKDFLTIHLDGILSYQETHPQPISGPWPKYNKPQGYLPPTARLYFGEDFFFATSGLADFPGMIDEFRMWSIRKSTEDIRNTMNCGISRLNIQKAVSTGNLVVYYTFNDMIDGKILDDSGREIVLRVCFPSIVYLYIY